MKPVTYGAIGGGVAVVIAATVLLVFQVPNQQSSNNELGQGDMFNKLGNILISDQFNNRVVEVNPVTKDMVWSFGSGNSSLCNPGPGTIIGTNDAERLSDGLTLISGTGLSVGASGSMPKG
ncbi:MAG: hypothetical protein KGH81_07505, partial [Thaumarchaeota archaeon]|nr:hypothetical protein [Nitrososphaerota archaeon]